MVQRHIIRNIVIAVMLQATLLLFYDYQLIRQLLAIFIPLALASVIIAKLLNLLKDKKREDRIFLYLLLISFFFYLSSYLIWFVDLLRGVPIVSTTLSFSLWILVYPLLCSAVLVKLIQLKNKDKLIQHLFTIVTFFIIVGTFMLHYVIFPYIETYDDSFWHVLILFTEPLLSGVLLGAGLILYFLSTETSQRATVFFFVSGLFIQALAESVYVVQRLLDNYTIGNTTDVLWILALLCFLSAVRMLEQEPKEINWRLMRLIDHQDSLFPYFVILGFVIYCYYQIALGLNIFSIAVFLLMVLLIIHQLVVVRRNSRLINDYQRAIYYDELTNLRNRTSMIQDLPTILNKAKRYQKVVSIILIDIDRFKTINDSLGHEAGDYVLKKIAKRFEKIISASYILYRIGGDEFVFIGFGLDRTTIEQFVHSAMAELKRTVKFHGTNLNISASVGISMFPDNNPAGEGLFQYADAAMYQAKAQGKNQYIFFDDSLKHALDRRLLLENELRTAVEDDELVVYYQSKMNILTHECVGYEALVRWNHPSLGLISPGEFIPIAEETGEIKAVGAYVLNAAIKQNKKWQDEGFGYFPVSVNVSAEQFNQFDFVDQVKKMLKRHQLTPKYLELEITESIMQDVETVLPVIQAFKAMGIQLSLDDFGTGYSSLYILKELPVDTIKIDQSFVRTINDPRSESIVKTIIDIGTNLGMQVIAEGIETFDHLEHLKAKGCIFGQGYYYSRPVPVEKVKKCMS